MSTSHQGSPLARRQSEPRVDARIAEQRLRVALHAVIADSSARSGQHTPSPEHFWHDNSRDEPRAPIACEKERDMLNAAIAQGCTTPMRIVSYYLARLTDSLAQFPEELLVSDVLYVRLMAEEAEALEAQALAQGMPTAEHCAAAVRETREAITVQLLECASLEQRISLSDRFTVTPAGRAALLAEHPLPMGATPR